MTYKEEFISFMARAGLLNFGDFPGHGGREIPYSFDTGNYRTGAQAARLGDYYAACIQEHLPDGIDCLFGPAYRGIPLAVAAASSLYRLYGRDLPYCFNRKERKDHGEGGTMVGYKPQTGDRVVIVEDMLASGAAARDCAALLRSSAGADVRALVISIDHMERRPGGGPALRELEQELGIAVYPIVTLREIVSFLHDHALDGTVYIDNDRKRKIDAYLAKYGTG